MQIGFAGLLTIVFVVLKLMGTITWPWIWVVSPLWIGLILWIVLVILLFVMVNWASK